MYWIFRKTKYESRSANKSLSGGRRASVLPRPRPEDRTYALQCSSWHARLPAGGERKGGHFTRFAEKFGCFLTAFVGDADKAMYRSRRLLMCGIVRR
jgi:hypothetical protein